MKKQRYFIEVECFESTMVQEFELSKENYYTQLNRLLRVSKEAEKNPDCYDIFLYQHTVKEYEKVTVEIYAFRSGCTTTYLTTYICKDGYCFKNKSNLTK